jgi:hypothetical protein
MMTVFVTARVLHILCAALWLGAALFISVFLMPALKRLGPNGEMVMTALAARGFPIFMPTVAGLTVLSGLWLYWRYTGGFDPAVSSSRAGIVFGLGGVLGVIAAIIGGSVAGRSAKQVVALESRASSLPEGAERARLAAQIQALRQRVTTSTRIVTVLLVVTIILMAIGHYV